MFENECGIIDQFQPKPIYLSARLWGITIEPFSEVYKAEF